MGCEMNRKEYNKSLVERFPFLLPRRYRTDEVPENYDYSYTELDEMPEGWRIAFGEQMCQEIADCLRKDDTMDEYRILQIKEKFGFLHWYCSQTTREVYDIISKYSNMSKRICLCCGKPATRITTSWISPYCDDCVPTYGADKKQRHTISIEEFFAEIGDD